MSSGLKWIIVLVVIIIAGVVLWKSGLVSLAPTPPAQTSEQATSTPQVQSGLPTTQSNTSDQALTQDNAAIGTQFQGLSQDQGEVDQSLNDQPVQQSY